MLQTLEADKDRGKEFEPEQDAPATDEGFRNTPGKEKDFQIDGVSPPDETFPVNNAADEDAVEPVRI
ncbi:MAG: hypothetical protein IH991_17300 [Planctomycetes bacterium]|nr:hypothetical protein [Planctomycetota bacterium]